MSTRFSSVLFADSSTDANFRAWAQFVEDTLVTTGGWVVTGDTGQTLPSALVHPTVANTKMGYRIYRMADSLQATAPVFMRLDYGSGAAIAAPAFWVTIGGGSNGSGTITSVYWNGGALATANVLGAGSSASQVNNCYGSASTNRLSLGMFVSSIALLMIFTLERSKDSSGNDTGNGLLLCWTTSSGLGTYASRYVLLAAGAQPSQEVGISYILNRITPSESFGGDLGVGLLICYRGVAQQPGMNFAVIKAADAGNEANFSMVVYGNTRTYQQLGAQSQPRKTMAGSNVLSDSNARCCIRFD